MENRAKALEKLNMLLEKNYDAEEVYKEAADNSENPLIRNILKSEAQKRREFGIKIKDEISKLGGVPEKGESASAKMRTTWLDIKSALTGDSDKAIVEECKKGDKAAMEEYEEVLKESELTVSSRKVVQQQREEITDMYHQWDNLKI